MASYNRVILIGNLTRDPELRYTPKGSAVAKVGLAVNRKWRTETGEQKEECTFVDIDIFGKTAENVANFLRKGSSMHCEGRLRLDEWTDKQSGQKRQRLGVVAESVQFLGGKSDGPRAERPPAAQATSAPASDAPNVPDDSDSPPF